MLLVWNSIKALCKTFTLQLSITIHFFIHHQSISFVCCVWFFICEIVTKSFCRPWGEFKIMFHFISIRMALIISWHQSCSFRSTYLLNYSTTFTNEKQEVKDEKYQVDCELLYEIHSTVIIMSLWIWILLCVHIYAYSSNLSEKTVFPFCVPVFFIYYCCCCRIHFFNF